MGRLLSVQNMMFYILSGTTDYKVFTILYTVPWATSHSLNQHWLSLMWPYWSHGASKIIHKYYPPHPCGQAVHWTPRQHCIAHACKGAVRYLDGLVQDSSISSASALEILQSCTKLSIYCEYLLYSRLYFAVENPDRMIPYKTKLPA